MNPNRFKSRIKHTKKTKELNRKNNLDPRRAGMQEIISRACNLIEQNKA
jgi:hypothetical protein